MYYTHVRDRAHFAEIIERTPGTIVFKFGATWCGPCKRIEAQVHGHFRQLPANVTVYDLDVDENVDVFAHLRSKKLVPGVPTLLMYASGGHYLAPIRSVSGANPAGIDAFFVQK